METSVAEQFTAYIKNILLIQQIEKKPDTCCFFSWMAIKGSITLHFRQHQIQARPQAPLLISLTIQNSSQFRPITQYSQHALLLPWELSKFYKNVFVNLKLMNPIC